MTSTAKRIEAGPFAGLRPCQAGLFEAVSDWWEWQSAAEGSRPRIERRGLNLELRSHYSAELVDALRDLPERSWEPERRVWIVPARRLASLVPLLKAHRFAVHRSCFTPDESLPNLGGPDE